MQYNLHPIFVHFPIALLTIYSLIKIIPVSKFFKKTSWHDIEMLLLSSGLFFAMIAASTGEMAERSVKGMHKIVETHAAFASFSMWMYAVILIGELMVVISKNYSDNKYYKSLELYLKKIEKIITNKTFVKVLAVLGLIGIFVTGLLGGVMVYGTTADPLAPFVMKILGLSL